MLKLYLRKGDVRKDVLSDIQSSGDQLQLAMSSYIEWLAQRYDELTVSVPGRFRQVVQEVSGSMAGFRARQPDIVPRQACTLHSSCMPSLP